jgi:hypothetical protein
MQRVTPVESFAFKLFPAGRNPAIPAITAFLGHGLARRDYVGVSGEKKVLRA